jgi:hypothetical protein
MKLAALVAIALWVVVQETQKPATQQAPAANQPASQPAGRTPEQAGVLKELLRSVDRPAAVAPEPIRSSTPSPTAKRDEALELEGTRIVDRPGRLIRGGERSSFKFTTADEKAFAAPLELLPNSWLEYLEREAESGEAEFIITAEVTRYRGRNYLLIMNYRRQISHGNLTP